MNKYLLALVAVSIVFGGCSTKPQYYQYKDDDLTVKAMNINKTGDAPETIFSARITPGKLATKISDTVKIKMVYKMDSCFYLQAGQKQIYPAIIQSVANGVPGTFEYMVSFDNTELPDDGFKIIYQDKYLNHRKYILSLTKD